MGKPLAHKGRLFSAHKAELLAGTVTSELSLVSVTVKPPAGAIPVRLTVQLAEDVVAMAPGVQLRLASDMPPDRTVSVAVCVTPEELADSMGV